MRTYIVNARPDNKGFHEVHVIAPTECGRLPDEKHRMPAGRHSTCQGAVAAAEATGYEPADGCARCSPDCHRG